MEYTIHQRATIWYELIVEADTKEQAIDKAQAGEELECEIMLDTVIFEDDFEIMEDN